MMIAFPDMVKAGLTKARTKHPTGIRSPHEALGVIREEYAEFEQEVYAQDFDKAKALKELTHLAAMCQRAAEDLELI